jgi:hypothetical protein
MHVFFPGWSTGRGPTPSTNKGAGVPRNPQTDFTEMDRRTSIIECTVRASVEGQPGARIHAPNTVLYIDSTQHPRYTDDPIASAAQKRDSSV